MQDFTDSDREHQRLVTLNALNILDTEPEVAFDSIVALAKCLAGSDVALISLIAADRQWFKARLGLEAAETPRDVAFCARAILEDAVLCVSDASIDPRFSANPLVTGEPHIRSYIGAPILVQGQRIGAVCAFSSNVRRFDAPIREQFRLLAVLAAERMELRRQMSFTSGLANATSDAVIASDENGNITHWGGGAERMFGYTAAEALRLPLEALMPERLKAAHHAGFARFRESGGSELAGRTTELAAQRKDGTEFIIDLNVAVWTEGKKLLIGGIVRDATDRRSLSEARLANEAQSRFLANMSHEIRTPLNGLLGIAHVLERGELNDAQRDLVRVMRVSAEALDTLLGAVLESARLESGETVVNAEAFDVGEVLSKAAALHGGAASAKGLKLTCIGVEPGSRVVGDAIKIGQIVGNLLSNAIKFTDVGEVRLSVEHGEDAWRFTVSDTGVGFTEEEHHRIFLRFQQADNSSTRSHGGSGLGLSISRRLAQAMGGDLSASSEPGVGSTFRVTLPLPAEALGSPNAKPVEGCGRTLGRSACLR